MKLSLLLVVASLVFIPLLHSQSAALYSEAQRAYLAGDVENAKEKFLAVLSDDPTNLGAKNYLKTIAFEEKRHPKSGMTAQLQALILPKVSFKEASFDSVLEYLKTKAAEVSGGKVTPSFVLQTPPDFAKNTPVTLELANVPFTEVLRYLGELTSTKFAIQTYAIVITPK